MKRCATRFLKGFDRILWPKEGERMGRPSLRSSDQRQAIPWLAPKRGARTWGTQFRLAPGFGGGDAFLDGGVGFEEPLHKPGRRAFGEVLLGKLRHRSDEGLDSRNALPGVQVGFALVHARQRVHRRHEEKPK